MRGGVSTGSTMRSIVTALIVYVIAAAAVFGLQLLAVTTLLAWR